MRLNISYEGAGNVLTQEVVYIKDYRGVREIVTSLGSYFEHYNNQRLYQSLDYKRPATIYFQ